MYKEYSELLSAKEAAEISTTTNRSVRHLTLSSSPEANLYFCLGFISHESIEVTKARFTISRKASVTAFLKLKEDLEELGYCVYTGIIRLEGHDGALDTILNINWSPSEL